MSLFDLEHVDEQPYVPVEQPEGGFPKGMEDILNNLEENQEQVQGQGGKSLEEVLRNLEEAKLAENGRGAVQEVTAGGIIRETISKLADLVFHPEGSDVPGQAMRDVESAAAEWHLQEDSYTCAIACQEFIIQEFTGADISEYELRQLAQTRGWYVDTGTPLDDIGKLMEVYGIRTDMTYEADFRDLKQALSEGNRAIVAVNNLAVTTDWCDCYPMYSCNHAIEVIGIDDTDPENVKVIINDPGVEDGCAKVLSYDNFMDAWKGTSGGYMVTAYRNEEG